MIDEMDFEPTSKPLSPEQEETLEAISKYQTNDLVETDEVAWAVEEIPRGEKSLKEDTPIILPEPHYDGPIALMERGRELMLAAHRGMTPPVRSWKIEAEQWWADCNDWAEANPTADN